MTATARTLPSYPRPTAAPFVLEFPALPGGQWYRQPVRFVWDGSTLYSSGPATCAQVAAACEASGVPCDDPSAHLYAAWRQVGYVYLYRGT